MTVTVADLSSAAREAGAPCLDDPSFTSPRSRAVIEGLVRRCGTCPVLDLCRQVVREIRPTAGVWAGQAFGDPARQRRARLAGQG